ncbi:MAG TPA: hypothetical protein VGK58_06940 [Lacipirellulaceae bacterium]
MKVTNWRRNLIASLVAGGLMSPAAINAADFDTNLVANPGFESVSFGTTGDYGAPMVLNWSGGPGFAYSHNPGVTGIPDYADGADPPGAGDWYFTSNNNPNGDTGDWRAPDLVFQDIDISTGATGTQIASGEAAVRLSAFMSSYLDDHDSGNVQVDFKNNVGAVIGSARIEDPDFGPNNVWSRASRAAFVPVGTTSLRVSLFGTPRTFGADGYIDNVDMQITNAANELLFLEVNTTTGQVVIKNQTGDPFRIDYYEIISPGGSTNGAFNSNGTVDAADYVVWRRNLNQSVTLPNDPTPGTVDTNDYNVWRGNFGKSAGSLNPTAWNSLQEQNLPGLPAGNGTGNGWEEADSSSAGVLSELYLTGNSHVANAAMIPLGAAFNVGGQQNLVFRYGVVPDNGAGGFTDPGRITQGFVRYVTSGISAAVPEPCSVVFVGIGLISIAAGGCRFFSRRNTG